MTLNRLTLNEWGGRRPVLPTCLANSPKSAANRHYYSSRRGRTIADIITRAKGSSNICERMGEAPWVSNVFPERDILDLGARCKWNVCGWFCPMLEKERGANRKYAIGHKFESSSIYLIIPRLRCGSSGKLTFLHIHSGDYISAVTESPWWQCNQK